MFSKPKPAPKPIPPKPTTQKTKPKSSTKPKSKPKDVEMEDTPEESSEPEVVIPPKPKRPKNAYMFYIADKRESVKAEKPELKPQEVVSYVSGLWNAMSSEEKQPYTKKANKDKERYRRENEIWKAKHGSDEAASKKRKAPDSSDQDEPKSKKQKKSKKVQKKKKDPLAPKRSKNAFMFFTEHMRVVLKEEHPELKKQQDVLRLIGERWKELNEEDKKPFLEKQKNDKERYATEMSEYRATKTPEE